MRIHTSERINSANYTFLDSIGYVVLAGRLPGIITSTYNSLIIDSFPYSIFTRAVKISNESYVFRIFERDEKSTDQIFIKGNIRTREIKKENGISEKNNDAGLSTDGRLLFDDYTKTIIYSPYARNHFLHLDTNLNLIKTISAISEPSKLSKSKASNITSPNEHVQAYASNSPKILSHPYSCVDRGILFALSGLRADNENQDLFNNSSVIDTYDILSGKYLGSFTLPKAEKEFVRKFKVIGDHIIATYKSHIALFKINQPLKTR